MNLLLKNKTYYVLILLTMACYIFRGVIVKFGFGFIPYFLTVLLLVVYQFKFKKTGLKFDSSVYFFPVMGLFMTFISFFIIKYNAVVASICGFLVLFLNYLIWVVILSRLNKNEFNVFFDYLDTFIFCCAIISGLLAIYQILFDTTIWGMAQSGLYSDEDAMASGKYQSRATALFTSAQNYGIFMGMAFCFGFTHRLKKRIIWILGLLIIILGIFVSNSRSASVCVVVTLVFGAINSFRVSKTRWTTIVSYVIVGLLIYFALINLINSDFGFLFDRLLHFKNEESQIVYDRTFNQFDEIKYLTGLGMGYRSWTVNSLLGADLYRQSYGESYYSVESFFLNLLVQGGLLLLISFIIVVVKSVTKSYRKGTLPVIICMIVNMIFTPSMSGLAISFIFWPYLLRELIINRSR